MFYEYSVPPPYVVVLCCLEVDRYVFFRADTDYCRSSRPITDILNPIYMSGVKMKMNAKINNNKSSDKKRSLNAFKHVFNSENC